MVKAKCVGLVGKRYVEVKPNEAYELSIVELLIWCC